MTWGIKKKNNHSFLWLYWGILKNNQDGTNHSKIKTLRYFGLRSSALPSKTETTTKWINKDLE